MKSIERKIVYFVLPLVILSILVFYVTLDISFIDSLYFVLTTITTVGYGDINL